MLSDYSKCTNRTVQQRHALIFCLSCSLRNEDPSAGVAKKEVLGRIWWAHFAFERFLSATMGRPSQGIDHSASVPPPLPITSSDIDNTIINSRFGDQLNMSTGLPLPRDQPTMSSQSSGSSPRASSSMLGDDIANSGVYLKHIVQLCAITQGALHLYGSHTASQSWQSVQKIISSLDEELEIWATSLPDGLNFCIERVKERHLRERNSLEILYHNTKILINRPCLCRLDRHIQHMSASYSDLKKKSAAACVASAKAIASSLTDDPVRDVTAIYKSGPWWNMVHAIMQSLVVLLIEVRLRPRDRQTTVLSLKKLIRWLRAMRSNNGVAGRAYSIAFNLLKKVSLSIELVSYVQSARLSQNSRSHSRSGERTLTLPSSLANWTTRTSLISCARTKRLAMLAPYWRLLT
jgi:hypothetical protein